jgi:hypothetical protein
MSLMNSSFGYSSDFSFLGNVEAVLHLAERFRKGSVNFLQQIARTLGTETFFVKEWGGKGEAHELVTLVSRRRL